LEILGQTQSHQDAARKRRVGLTGLDELGEGVGVRVLVSGATGFVGRHLCRLLSDRGYSVVGITHSDNVNLEAAVEQWHEADIRNAERVAGILRIVRPDAIVHLAGASSVGASFASPHETWITNVIGTLNIVDGIRTQTPNARLLTITSAEQYAGIDPAALPITMSCQLAPLSPYGASKAAAYILAGQFRENYGLDIIRIAPLNHIGPGQSERFVIPKIARQIAHAEADNQSVVSVDLGNIDIRRDFTDVRDVVRGYADLLIGTHRENDFLICSGKSISLRDVIEKLSDTTDLDVKITQSQQLIRPNEAFDIYGSFAAIHTETGWEPEIDIERTLMDTVDYWRMKTLIKDV